MFNSTKTTSKNKSLTIKGVPFILDAGSQIKGDLELKSDVRIDGILEGNIITTGNVIIGEKGRLTGNVISNNFYLFGHFSGDADVTTRSIVHTTGKYFGRIVTEIINIESGGIINASISIRNSITHHLEHKEVDSLVVKDIVKDEPKTAKVRLMYSPEVNEPEFAEEGSFLLKNLVAF
jgi:cytoskeletal protein CcmA (bactofilin family)